MKALYLECKMGVAGDMLMSALSELVNQDEFIEKMNSIGLEGITFEAVPSMKCGIKGTHITVKVNGEEEKSVDVNEDATFFYLVENVDEQSVTHILDHIQEIEGISNVKYENNTLSYNYNHDYSDVAENKIYEIFAHHIPRAKLHSHGHTHLESHEEHHGMHLDDIHEVLDKLDVSERVKKDAENIYQIIAQAESEAHGVEIDHIHFHEVGTMDAIADIVGNCVLMEMIQAERVIVSPIALGNGMVKCAHGILPVPAPAVASILEGVPTYSGRMQGELTTPTGAALVKYFADTFDVQPTMKTGKIGYGMGNKDFEAANCVRAFLGEILDDGEVCELKCNMDDITGENIGHAFDVLFENGALDVNVTPVNTKKNRPGYVFNCMCLLKDRDKMIELMFKHLTTLGIREYTCVRHALDRSIETVNTSFGEVRIKKSSGYNVTREKIEFDDLAKIAKKENLSIEEVRETINKEIKE